MIPAFMYGSESWTLLKRHKLRVKEVEESYWYFRNLFGVPWKDRWTLEQVCEWCGVKVDVLDIMKTHTCTLR